MEGDKSFTVVVSINDGIFEPSFIKTAHYEGRETRDVFIALEKEVRLCINRSVLAYR
jgi:hypothetical protein